MKKIIVALLVPVVVAMFLAGRVYQEANAAIASPQAAFCDIWAAPPHVIGSFARPREVSVRVGVTCSRRVAWIKITACLSRYGSERDQLPKIACAKSATAVLDDAVAMVLRHKCDYTTYDYLWVGSVTGILQKISGTRTKWGQTIGGAIESRCH